MSYQFTLSDAKNAGLQAAAGSCSGSDEFVRLINEVQRRLIKRGDWYDTEVLVKFCIYNKCLTLPRYVGRVSGLRFCGMPATEIRNNWYAIIGPHTCGFSSNVTMRDGGTAPCYNEISGSDGKKIRAYIEKSIDIGRTITIYGTDAATNLPLRMPDGTPGLKLTLASPYVETTVNVRHITAVVKDETKGYVFLYEYEAATSLTRDLARYEANETNPRYRRSVINGFCSTPACAESDGVSMHHAEALVKLEFVPVKNDSDFLLIDDFDAIKLGLQAIREEDATNDVGAEIKWNKAVRELNFRDRNKSPSHQTTVRVDLVGGALTSPM